MELHIKYNSQSQKPKQMKSLLIPRIGKVWKNGNSCVIFGRLLITTDSLGTIWYYPGNIEKVNIPQPSNSTLYIFFITKCSLLYLWKNICTKFDCDNWCTLLQKCTNKKNPIPTLWHSHWRRKSSSSVNGWMIAARKSWRNPNTVKSQQAEWRTHSLIPLYKAQ
jgi:hypothetical protein